MSENSYSTVAPKINAPNVGLFVGLDMSQLVDTQWEAVFDALTIAISNMRGIQAQPRCGKDFVLNPAGVYLEQVHDFLLGEKERLIAHLKAHKPVDSIQRQIRAHLLLRYEAECGELSMPEMAAYALSLSKDTN